MSSFRDREVWDPFYGLINFVFSDPVSRLYTRFFLNATIKEGDDT